MTGTSRHIWEHSIPPVETPRYSMLSFLSGSTGGIGQ
jgi:alkylated DNA repair dioxygenase AlkB